MHQFIILICNFISEINLVHVKISQEMPKKNTLSHVKLQIFKIQLI